jgi:hypothetical protein
MRSMTLAVFAFSTVPLYAQGQQSNAAKLKADARKVVGIIGADKAKTQTYCQFANLSDQFDQANQAKDSKKAVVRSQNIG